ncbi:hypothetical protein NTGBS_160024 [Candidatus Nitrotoga sp. BS]|nr:hypothetical protein NTGBS_160024 [Candidatus Nitrotoga sp. BS]
MSHFCQIFIRFNIKQEVLCFGDLNTKTVHTALMLLAAGSATRDDRACKAYAKLSSHAYF